MTRWDDPEVQTVAPGVHRVPVPLPHDGLRAVNVYLIEDRDRVVMIDAGMSGPVARAAVGRGLDVVGAEVGDIRRILITHLHYDHLAQAKPLMDEGAGEYHLGAGEKPGLTNIVSDPRASRLARMDWLERLGAVELAEKGRSSAIEGDFFEWGEPGRWLLDGDEEPLDAGGSLVTVNTPGHTSGHVCFTLPERKLLFSGDHVLPHITPSIGLEPVYNQMALVDFIGSLGRVRGLDVDLVLPAHGAPFADLAGRVDELVAHHDTRLAACLAAVAEGGSTAFEVAQRIGWTRRETPFDQLDTFNQVLATWETAAHMELLSGRDDVVRDAAGEHITYRVPAGR